MHPFAELIKQKIISLRPKLMDTSRNSPLINNSISARSAAFIRIIDEKPQSIYNKLVKEEAKLTLASLPSLDEDPPDENNREFREALEVSSSTDQKYIDVIEAIDADNDEKSFEKQAQAERELKDRTRELLGYAQRITSSETTTLATHARNHEIDPSFDLPQSDYMAGDDRHEDNELQTLVLKKQLISRLGKIRSRDRLMSEERGLNTLYLALGFLIWRDPASNDPSSNFKSPLILLPISLDNKRTAQGLEYSISTRDDPLFNPVLNHKLKAELGVELWEPEAQFSDFDVEAYFSKLTEVFADKPGWRVSRQGVIGVYPFQGIELYNDINPDEVDFSKFDVISQLFSGTNSSGEESSYQLFTEDDIETEQAEALVPKIVVDADSSQYLSLVKAASGQNMALEGPPGSGKSQTIVNMIANAISQNKKILFVAQKGTALEVVLSRLTVLNLDTLILPLMGQKGDKGKFYDALKRRLSLDSQRTNKGSSYQTIKDDIKTKRSHIARYINTLKSHVSGTSITVHQTLGLATAIKDDSELYNASSTDLLPAFDRLDRHLDIGFVERLCAKAEAWETQLEKTKLVDGSVWAYLSETKLDHLLLDKIGEQARIVQSELTGIVDVYSADSIDKLTSSMSLSTDGLSLGMVADSCEGLVGLGNAWHGVIENEDNIKCYLNDYSALKRSQSSLAESCGITWTHLNDISGYHAVFNSLLLLVRNSQIKNISHGFLDELKESSVGILGELGRVKSCALRFENELGIENVSLNELKLLSVLAAEFPILRDPNITKEISRSGLDALASTVSNARNVLAAIRTNLVSLDAMPSRQRLFEMQAIIRDSGPLSIFSSHFRQCKRDCNSMFGSAKFIKSTAEFYLSELLAAEKDWSNGSIEAIFGSAIDKNVKARVIEVQKSLDLITEKLKINEIHVPEFLSKLSPNVLNFFDESSSVFTHVDFNSSWEVLDEQISEHDMIVSDIAAIAESGLLSSLDIAEVSSVDKLETISSAIDESIELSSKNIQLRRSIEPYSDILYENGDISDASVVLLLNVLAFRSNLDENIIDSIDTADDGLKSYQQFCDLIGRLISVKTAIDIFYSDCDQYGFNNKPPTTLADISRQIDSTVIEDEGPTKLIQISIIKEEISQFGLLPFVEATLAVEESKALRKSIEIAVVKKLAETAYGQFGSIVSEFSGARLDQLRLEFKELDRRLINLSNNEILDQAVNAAQPPRGVSRGKKSEYTDMGLIVHQLENKRRISPSKLVKRSIGALIELHPCWMMVPTAVASYLPREELFDLVVIDEASQMTPEHSISALMRAKQAIIVGDTNQLPPSNFFKSAAGIEEEDSDIAIVEESILELANAAFHPKHRLLWHYRSRHESLIAFSNFYIYENDLVIFPSPNGKRDKMGVDLIRANGVYQSSINPVEAALVADAVVLFMENDSDRSLGIVTMNIKQKDMIHSMVMRHAETNRHVSDYIEKWDIEDSGLQRFFVKNIENVQGDERDVIFISTVYGKDPLGRFRQGFGPINGLAGMRRLNVLFTRAKEKITTFTSIPLDQLNPGEDNQGAVLLKRWLEYSGTGVVGERLKDSARSKFGPDSPFEEHVIERIESLGYEAIPQVGVSNYFIDIGVKHPSYDLGYICGVECDGASYHSSKSARDRDVLRQEVLEGLGWDIYRIWSTDWFKNSILQTEMLKKYLDQKLELKLGARIAEQPIKDAPVEVFSEAKGSSDVIPESRSVVVGSKVVLEYQSGPRAGMKSKFVLVNPKTAGGTTPGYDPLPITSPLGQEVIGSEEGDTVSFEVLEAFVDVSILEVLT